MIKTKRVYEKPEKSDGIRILIDRLWPRGLSKEKAKIDRWLKEITPNNELRKWFSHDIKKWVEFQRRYKEEIKGKAVLMDEIKKLEKMNKIVTLLFSAKDILHNNAVVLKVYLTR